MRQRLLLLIIGLLSFGWIIFSAYDLLSNENLVDFKTYFTPKDKKVYVIQDPQAIDWNNEGIVTTELNRSLYASILKNSKEQLNFFFSASQTKILVEKKGNWSKKEVVELLHNGLFALSMGKLKKFEFGKLHGCYNGNQLLIYDGELPTAKPFHLPLSAKASYAWWKWDAKQKIRLTEMYLKKDGVYQYVKYSNPNPALHKIDDQLLYAEVIPDFFKQYYFYEKNYAAQLDPNFKKSPWYKCVKSGFIHLKKDSASLIVFDYAENAHPIQTLNEHFQKEELNNESAVFKQLRFCTVINSSLSTWYVGVLGQYGFASTDKSLLDQALAAATLGQTLSQDEKRAARFYANMPKKVSARWIDATQKKTTTLLGHLTVETSYQKLNDQTQNTQEEIRDYFVMNPGFNVLAFAAFAERGNAIALTENHQLVGYINGLRKWEKPLTQEVKALYAVLGAPQYVCAQFEHEAQIFDKSGRLLFKLSHEAGSPIQVIDNKGKKEFICSNGGNSLQLINENGSVVKQFTLGGQLKNQMSFKQSGKAYVSILTDKSFQIIDLAKRKVALKQSVDSAYVLVGNSLNTVAVKIQKNSATVISLSGQKQFKVPADVHCFGAYLQGDKTIIVMKRACSLFAYDQNGSRIWEKTLPAIELSQFTSFQNPSKQTVVGLLDAIGNQIYLLDDLGRNLDKDKRHGAKELQISAFGNNAYSITTYLGAYIIQYTKQ
ncbi:MAG: hypothetical protein ACKOWX_05120 [Flavobacteriales bacterium]